jgi:hypothetical protein
MLAKSDLHRLGAVPAHVCSYAPFSLVGSARGPKIIWQETADDPDASGSISVLPNSYQAEWEIRRNSADGSIRTEKYDLGSPSSGSQCFVQTQLDRGRQRAVCLVEPMCGRKVGSRGFESVAGTALHTDWFTIDPHPLLPPPTIPSETSSRPPTYSAGGPTQDRQISTDSRQSSIPDASFTNSKQSSLNEPQLTSMHRSGLEVSDSDTAVTNG